MTELVTDKPARCTIDSSTSAARFRTSLRAIETAPLVGIAMKAGYSEAF